MIIINLYEIIINILAFSTSVVLLAVGIILWTMIGSFIYKQLIDRYGKTDK